MIVINVKTVTKSIHKHEDNKCNGINEGIEDGQLIYCNEKSKEIFEFEPGVDLLSAKSSMNLKINYKK